jgi:hypothetical protein
MIDEANGGVPLRFSFSQLNQLMYSPREIVKFFHSDSACIISLKDLYYKLKVNIRRDCGAMVAKRLVTQRISSNGSVSAALLFTALVSVH